MKRIKIGKKSYVRLTNEIIGKFTGAKLSKDGAIQVTGLLNKKGVDLANRMNSSTGVGGGGEGGCTHVCVHTYMQGGVREMYINLICPCCADEVSLLMQDKAGQYRAVCYNCFKNHLRLQKQESKKKTQDRRHPKSYSK